MQRYKNPWSVFMSGYALMRALEGPTAWGGMQCPWRERTWTRTAVTGQREAVMRDGLYSTFVSMLGEVLEAMMG